MSINQTIEDIKQELIKGNTVKLNCEAENSFSVFSVQGQEVRMFISRPVDPSNLNGYRYQHVLFLPIPFLHTDTPEIPTVTIEVDSFDGIDNADWFTKEEIDAVWAIINSNKPSSPQGSR